MHRETLTATLLATASVGAILAVMSQPLAAATFTVTNLNDSGAGSLRDAINQSNAAGVGNIINFNAGLSGGISLTSDLPALTNSVTINFPTGPSLFVFLAGTGGVIQAGAGTTVVDSPAAHAYNGSTQLQSGTFRIGPDGYVADNSALVTTAGSTLDLTLGFAGFDSLSGNGTVNIGAGQFLSLNGNTASTTFSGTLSGAGDLVLFGGGHGLTLNTPDIRTGATALSAGLFIGSGSPPFTTFLTAGAPNVFSPNSAFFIFGNGTLDLNNFDQTIGSLSGGFGPVLLGSATLTTGGDNTSTEFDGTISGTGGLTKVGAGTFTLTSDVAFGLGSATYTGPTLVAGGVLQAGAADSFAPLSAHTINAGNALDLNNFDNTIGSLAGAGAVTLGTGILTTGGDNTSTVFGGTMSGTGGLVKAGTGVFTLAGSTSYSGPTTIGSGALKAGALNALSPASAFTVSPGATLDLNNFNQTIGSLAGLGQVTLGSSTLTTGGDNTSTVFGGTMSGTGGLAKAGTGVFTLASATAYSGPTTVGGGTLQGGAVNAFAPASAFTVSPGATLDLNGFNQTIASLAGAGAVTLGAGTLTTGSDNTSTVYGGTISGTGGLVKAGTGVFTLAGSTTYSGSTTIGSGTLRGGAANAFSPASAFTVGLGATLDLNNFNQTIGSLSGPGKVTLGTATLTTGTDNTSTSFTGVVSGTGGLSKVGTGTFTLDGVNTYTGLTTVNGGTLVVGDVNSPGASIAGNVQLSSGTVAGHGTIVGSLSVNAGTVAPGGTIGTLTVGGAYTQSASSTLSIEVSPTVASQLKVGGAANLAGTLALVFDPGVYTATSYKIVTASSVSGTFATVSGTNPSGLLQAILYNPADVTLQLSTTPAPPLVIAPTNDTIYTALTSTLVFNGQRANAIILDRVGNRASGVADGEVALAGVGVTGLQLAQAGNGAVIGDLASALPQTLASQGAWFRGIGDFASVGGTGAIPGFSGSAGGFLAGFDRPVGDNAYLGVAGGYLHSTVNERSTSAGSADTGRLAVYGGLFVGPSLLTATAGYAHDWIDTNRGLALGTAIEGHGGNEATAAGQWSLPLQVQGFGGGIATLTPKAGVQFLHLGENGFSENGAGGFDLSSAGHGTDSFQPFAAVAASQKFVTADGTLITPEVRFGYDREALSGARTLTVTTVSGAPFPVTGIKPSRDMLTAGTGLVVQAGPMLSLYATYDAVLPTGNTVDQTVQAGMRLKF